MVNKDAFSNKCQEIEDKIFKIESGNPGIEPISDGVINVDEYLKSKYKILWILKESNDIVDGSGGGWSLNKTINESNGWQEKNRTGKKTFERMIYISYSILNDFPKYSEIPNISINHDVWKTIKSIAYINVKKIPGSSKAIESEIKSAYCKHKDLLLEQIEAYSPDIIIGGSTLRHFIKDLGLIERKQYGSLVFYEKDLKLYLNAYHPNVRIVTISEEAYCDEIITIAKEWSLKDNKKL